MRLGVRGRAGMVGSALAGHHLESLFHTVGPALEVPPLNREQDTHRV